MHLSVFESLLQQLSLQLTLLKLSIVHRVYIATATIICIHRDNNANKETHEKNISQLDLRRVFFNASTAAKPYVIVTLTNGTLCNDQ